jgi:hypothetical protein
MRRANTPLRMVLQAAVVAHYNAEKSIFPSTIRFTNLLAARYPLCRVWNRIPLKFFICLTFLCLWTKEWYPFSHFPMYARNSNTTTYLYLTDSSDNVIAMQRDFGVRSSMLKKYYETQALKLLKLKPGELPPELQQKIANDTLQSFYRTARNKETLEPLQPIKLWHRRISMTSNGTIVRVNTIIASGRERPLI